MTGARYISPRLHHLHRSTRGLLPTPNRPNEKTTRISKRNSVRLVSAALDTVDNRNILSDSHPQQESMQSLDIEGSEGSRKHIAINELRAMKGAGILQLLAEDRTGSYRSKIQKILSKGVRKCQRNALDLAGKVPFSLLMEKIGVDQHQLWVDSAQAGGLYDTADGFLPRKRAFVEIKGARLKAGTKNQYMMKKIRHIGTDWHYLAFVCRVAEPDDWLDADAYDRSGLWLGVVRRDDYMNALKTAKMENRREISVTVTPGNGTASGGKASKSWIGNCIHWTKSSDLTKSWFDRVFC